MIIYINIDKTKQITNLPNTENNPWIIIGDLNELSNPHRKASASKGNSTRCNNFKKFVQSHYLIDLGYISNPAI